MRQGILSTIVAAGLVIATGGGVGAQVGAWQPTDDVGEGGGELVDVGCGQGDEVDCGTQTTKKCVSWKYTLSPTVSITGGGLSVGVTCAEWVETTITLRRYIRRA